MAIFNSYVSLPEGIIGPPTTKQETTLTKQGFSISRLPSLNDCPVLFWKFEGWHSGHKYDTWASPWIAMRIYAGRILALLRLRVTTLVTS